MKNLLKNRKVLAALAALLLAVAAAMTGADLGLTGEDVAGVVCQVAACE
ncbi:transmembrane helix containing protein [Aeromonas phage vB_AspA_Tola]|nr:transmembrane helix containing protein [Aeromonas phage vB_AspA_Tola]